MMQQVFGADVAALRGAATQLRVEADHLDAAAAQLTGQLHGLRWLGTIAVRFVDNWNSQHRGRLVSLSGFLRETAEVLSVNADQQDAASSADSSFDHFARFGALDGRNAIVEAFYATTDGRRVDGDEIEIRQLDNGRWVVVLPGVVDLTDRLGDVARASLHGDALGPWFDGDQPDTVRRMEYAYMEANDNEDQFINPYARKVIEQMEAAGIPPGAEVMLIGHSFGAYTAMELAGNPMFNSSDGTSAGYHVNITHVLAAGADADWKFAEIPGSTETLLVNNRIDLAVRVEDGFQPNASPTQPGHSEVWFNGGSKGWGHHPDNYANYLNETSDPAVADFLSSAADSYGGSGQSFTRQVPDD